MKASKLLLGKLMEFEGLKLSAYRDAAGVVTIGYGHTWNVRMGDQISKYWARELLERDVAKVEEQLDTLGLVLTQGQTDALVSLVFNIGFDKFKSSTLLRLIRNGGSVNQICKEFQRWVYAGGRRMRGLEVRRAWESKRFFEL
jgi:lysozyme